MKASIKIPTHLSEITLEQYQKFLKVESESEDDYFLQCKMKKFLIGNHQI